MTDIVERLSQIANLKRGDPLIDAGRPNSEGWHATVTGLCQDAIAEIMRLRHIIEQHQAALQMSMDAGLMSSNPGGFREIKDGLKAK